MKNAVKFLAAIIVVLFSADFVFADVNQTATGGTGTGTATAESATASSAAAGSEANNGGNTFKNVAPLPEVGFTSFLAPGRVMDNEGWMQYCPAVYQQGVSTKETNNMKRKFQAADLLPWNWGGNINATMVGGKNSSATDLTFCMCYWPKTVAQKGDKVLGSTLIMGELNKPDELFMGQAFAFCKAEYNSNRVAMRSRLHKDGVTVGASVGGSALTSKVNDAGNSGVAFVGGGMFGINRTRTEDYKEFDVLCMNDGLMMCDGQPALPTSVVPPPQAKACDPGSIWARIQMELEACKHCLKPCLNNEIHRKQAGDGYEDYYYCTGDKRFLFEAIKQYKIADRDFLNGREPDGTRTRTLKGAQDTIYKTYYNWSWAVRELYGRDAQVSFARSKGLTMMPSSINDIKR